MHLLPFHKSLFLFLFFLLVASIYPPQPENDKAKSSESVQWLTMEEANQKAAQQEKRKIFVFITTSWCKWCQKMKKGVFQKPKVIRQLNNNFYPVKIIGDKEDRHELVFSMLEGRVVYPTSVILSKNFKREKTLQGYYSFAKLYPILVYYGGL